MWCGPVTTDMIRFTFTCTLILDPIHPQKGTGLKLSLGLKRASSTSSGGAGGAGGGSGGKPAALGFGAHDDVRH